PPTHSTPGRRSSSPPASAPQPNPRSPFLPPLLSLFFLIKFEPCLHELVDLVGTETRPTPSHAAPPRNSANMRSARSTWKLGTRTRFTGTRRAIATVGRSRNTSSSRAL